MKFRPTKPIRQLRADSTTRYEAALKSAHLSSLLAHAVLDQKGRPRGKNAKPKRPGAIRIIRTKSARAAFLAALAHLQDRAQQKNQTKLSQRLINRILRSGGLVAITDMPRSGELISQFLRNQKEVKYVVAMVGYLLRSHAHPEDRLPSTIERAKAFVWLWESDWGISKIGQAWETYKLAAPYLYALHLETSYRPSKIPTSMML